MNLILLSGGSGKRLWPLSNNVRSKQFIKIFRDEDGNAESMLQRMIRQIKAYEPDASITVAAGASQAENLRSQLEEEIDICLEPARRDTFPAIALASAYLKDVKKIPDDEVAVVCPVDSYVDNDFFIMLKELEQLARKSTDNLVLLGIQPAYASERYGYIIPDTNAVFGDRDGRRNVFSVKEFKEKPVKEDAKKYIQQGALWNGGIFAFKLTYMLGKMDESIGYNSYQKLRGNYEKLQKISFDYAVVEKEKHIAAIAYKGKWADVGTWDTLSDVLDTNVFGEGWLDEECENVKIINELDVPILVMGIKDAVISASPDGILISDKRRSSYIKPYVDELEAKFYHSKKSQRVDE